MRFGLPGLLSSLVVAGCFVAPLCARQQQQPTDAAGLAAAVADGALGETERAAALRQLQDRSALSVATLTAAMREESHLRSMAVAILRHEWVEWPAELLRWLDEHSDARLEVLRELAIAPRPAADAWVAERARSDDARERLLALAARSRAPDRDEALFVIDALLAATGNEAHWAAVRIDPAVADRLVSKLASKLAGSGAAGRMWPFFDRLSVVGQRQLLGVAAMLEDTDVEPLYTELARRGVEAYFERVRAALDGEIPLDDQWLIRAGKLLVTDSRVKRVIAVLADEQRSEQARLHAFDALVAAGCYHDSMAAFAEGEASRFARLLQSNAAVPEAVQLRALQAYPESDAVMRAFFGRELSMAVEGALIELVEQHREEMTKAGVRALAVAEQVLASRARDRGVAVALQIRRSDRDAVTMLYDLLGRRRDPVADVALRTELSAAMREIQPEEREVLRDHIRLVLAERGDRRQIEELLRAAPARSSVFVRRCRHAMPDLSQAQAAALFAHLGGIEDVDVRVEMMLWFDDVELAELRADLLRRSRQAEDDEEREVALRTLLEGPEREQLLRDWRLGKRDPEMQELIAYSALAGMPEQLRPRDVELLQEMLFAMPARQPERERRRAEKFPDGRTGFPIVAAIADRLRRSRADTEAVCAHASAVLAAGDLRGLVRQRFLCLWSALQANPQARTAAARATAELVLALDDPGDASAGAASYYLAQRLAADGEHARAAELFERAGRRLLAGVDGRMHARVHLGTRDPDAGIDPYAALAAAPHLQRVEAALQDDDKSAAAAAAVVAAEFAGRDAATHDAIDAILLRIR